MLALVDSFPECIEMLLLICMEILEDSKDGWKSHEAVFLILGRLHGDMESLNKQQLEITFTFAVRDMALEVPMLQGRALWFLAQFGDLLTSALLRNTIASSTHIMSQTRDIRLVFAVKSIKTLLLQVSNQMHDFAGTLIETLCRLIPTSKEELLFLLVETLTSVVKVNADVTARYEHLLGPLILNIWSHAAEGSLRITKTFSWWRLSKTFLNFCQRIPTCQSHSKHACSRFWSRRFPTKTWSLIRR